VYKDRNKQKEAAREAIQRFRAKNKGIALSSQKQGLENAPGLSVIPDLGNTYPVIPSKCNTRVIPKRQTFTDLPADVQHTITRISDSPEEQAVRTAIALDYQARHPGARHRGIDYEAEPRSTARPGDAAYQPSGVEEYCCGCNVVLPQLEQPRQHTGACMVCVMKGAA